MLSISQAKYQYPQGDFLLCVTQLHVAAGECVALTGPSGTGKTTLLHLAAGILAPHTGRIKIGDFELSAQTDAVRRRFRLEQLGLVFQSFELLAHLTARDNIELPCRLAGRAPDPSFASLVETLGISKLLERHPAKLSHGECQRVAIARALLHGPSLVLADEPTGNLDPANKQTVVELLLAACRERKAAVLMATHDSELLEMFDRTIAIASLAQPPGAAS